DALTQILLLIEQRGYSSETFLDSSKKATRGWGTELGFPLRFTTAKVGKLHLYETPSPLFLEDTLHGILLIIKENKWNIDELQKEGLERFDYRINEVKEAQK
ncbi:hypothetical protein LCGC14_1127620, partial [marine sediment metagenome]